MHERQPAQALMLQMRACHNRLRNWRPIRQQRVLVGTRLDTGRTVPDSRDRGYIAYGEKIHELDAFMKHMQAWLSSKWATKS